MKYLMITEYKAGEFDVMMKKDNEISADRQKNPKKYPKQIVAGQYVVGEWPKLSPDTVKAFDIVEADEEQIENHMAHWTSAMVGEVPSLKKTYVPLLDAKKVVGKMRSRNIEGGVIAVAQACFLPIVSSALRFHHLLRWAPCAIFSPLLWPSASDSIWFS